MLLVYGDESLDETQERVCAVAGVVGTEEAWAALESKWKERNGGVPFHANYCESDQGDYAPKDGEDPDTKHKSNKKLYKDLTMLLAESGLGGFGSAYDLAAQREAYPPPLAPPVYYQPFNDVVTAMRNFAHNQESLAKLTFDTRLESNHNAALMYAHLRESGAEWSDRLADEISFVCSRSHPRIQIADLFARETMKALDNLVGPVQRPPRKSWKALSNTGRFAIHARSTQYFAALKKEESPHELLGFTRGDFQSWLSERNRQWNFTAYVEFLHWHYMRLTPDQRDGIAEKIRRY